MFTEEAAERAVSGLRQNIPIDFGYGMDAKATLYITILNKDVKVIKLFYATNEIPLSEGISVSLQSHTVPDPLRRYWVGDIPVKRLKVRAK